MNRSAVPRAAPNERSVMSQNTNDRELLWELIEDIKFSMFTTRHNNGHLHSRPLTTQNTKEDQDSALWYFVSRDSDVLTDIAREPSVNVAFADPGDDSYVSVSGTASVVDDMAKKKQLWNKAAEAWFPGGVTDPKLALVKVEITHGNYWDVKENKLVQLFKMAKAVVTGEPPSGMGETGEVRLK